MSSETLNVIFFIILPVALIGVSLMIIFKNKKHAMQGISLYLFIAGTYLLSKSVKTSIAVIVGGIIILTATSLFTRVRERIKKRAYIAYTLPISSIGIIILYTIVSQFSLYNFSLIVKPSEDCFNISNSSFGDSISNYHRSSIPTLPYPPEDIKRCRIDMYYNFSSFIPINEKIYFSMCKKEATPYPVAVSSSYENKKIRHYSEHHATIILNLYSKTEDISSYYLCASYKRGCDDCISTYYFKK